MHMHVLAMPSHSQQALLEFLNTGQIGNGNPYQLHTYKDGKIQPTFEILLLKIIILVETDLEERKYVYIIVANNKQLQRFHTCINA